MKKVPFLLIYSRILIGVIILLLAFLDVDNNEFTIPTLIVIGLLTDVFDGVIARKVGVATEKLRVWDSNVDVFFWISVIGAVFYQRIEVVQTIWIQIVILLVLETLSYIISFLKFKKTIATHSYLAKFWTLTLLVFIVELQAYGTHHSFLVCFIFGAISRVEIIAIILLLKEWTTDVSSILKVKAINMK